MRDKGEIGVQMVLYKKKLCNVLNIFQGVKWDLLFVNRTKCEYDMRSLIVTNTLNLQGILQYHDTFSRNVFLSI